MNATISKVLELESRFEMYGDCKITAVFNAPKSEMFDASNYLNCHLYAPFEMLPTEDYYFFRFVSERNKGIVIEVRSNELFRFKKTLEEK